MIDFILSFMHFETELDKIIFMVHVSECISWFSLALGIISINFSIKIYLDKRKNNMYTQDEDIGN